MSRLFDAHVSICSLECCYRSFDEYALEDLPSMKGFLVNRAFGNLEVAPMREVQQSFAPGKMILGTFKMIAMSLNNLSGID